MTDPVKPEQQLWREYFAAKLANANVDAARSAAPAVPGAVDTVRRANVDSARNALAIHYLPLVRYQASKIAKNTPPSVTVDDLQANGVFGLCDAIATFDPARGVMFKTYAALRVRGAMLDFLREVDWVPRLVRRDARRFEDELSRARTELAREPTDDDLAERLSRLASSGPVEGSTARAWTVADVARLRRASTPVATISLSARRTHPDAEVTDRAKAVSELLADSRAANPADRQLALDTLRELTRGLSKTERLLVIMYYHQDATMKEIGQSLELSERRISQVHSMLIERLRAQLKRAA